MCATRVPVKLARSHVRNSLQLKHTLPAPTKSLESDAYSAAKVQKDSLRARARPSVAECGKLTPELRAISVPRSMSKADGVCWKFVIGSSR